MRKPRLFAWAAAAVLTLTALPFGAVPAAAAERTALTVGFDAEFPPYGYQNESGEYVGFDLSLAAELCTRRGWTLNKQPIDWDSKDSELKTGAIDCIWNGFTVNGREDQYTWSTPYVDNSQVVVVKADSPVKALADLAGKTVAVQADSSALAAFTGEDAEQKNIDLKNSFKDLQQVGDYNTAFLNLESGSVDAVCLDYGVANYEVKARGGKFVMLSEVVSSEKYGIGFLKGNTELRDQVQETLLQMLADGAFQRIADEWELGDSVCLKAGDSYPGEAAAVQTGDRTSLTVGFDAEFPPYGYQDTNGEYVGFDLSLAEELCTRRGWTLIKQPIDWDSKDNELKTGAIDCIWNGFTMNGREDAYTWSTPYVDNSQVVVVLADSGIKALSDLAGKHVAVQADSSALAAFTGEDAAQKNIDLKNSFADLQQVGDYNTAFLNLESGAVDAVCLDYGVANYEVKARGGKFAMLSEVVSSEKYGIGFLKGNTALRDQVQETLLQMLADGTFQRIADEWDLGDSVCLSAEDSLLDETETESESFGEMFLSVCGQLWRGVGASLAIFFLTLLFALPLGLLIAAGRMSKFKPLSLLVKLYISIVRGTPLMLQLLVVFFGPFFVFGIRTTASYRFWAVIIGFTLNYAAYFAEIYRSGIQAVPVGQHEACEILGYTRGQKFFKIVFPQMVKNIIPSITNEVITLVKDTSLAFAISYTEMFTLAKQVAAARATIMPLFIAGVFYYVFNFVVAFVMERIEKKMNYFR